MDILKEFVSKVLTMDESFSICSKSGKTTYHYMQYKNGNSKFIYAFRTYPECTAPNNEAVLGAVVSNGIVYVVDNYTIGGTYLSTLPNNAVLIKEQVQIVEAEALERVFDSFIDNLPVAATEDEPNQMLVYEARKIALTSEPITRQPIPKPRSVIIMDDFYDILAGYKDADTVVMDALAAQQDLWVRTKEENNALNKLLQMNGLYEPWEKDLAKVLNSIDAKQVTVEFTVNGKSASIKVSPETICYQLYKKDYFCSYNFPNGKQAESLMDHLSVSDRGYHTNHLTCGQISKILFRGKILYQREVQ